MAGQTYQNGKFSPFTPGDPNAPPGYDPQGGTFAPPTTGLGGGSNGYWSPPAAAAPSANPAPPASMNFGPQYAGANAGANMSNAAQSALGGQQGQAASSGTTPDPGGDGSGDMANPTPTTLPPSISGLNSVVGSGDTGVGASALGSGGTTASMAGLMGGDELRPLGWRRVPPTDGLALKQGSY